MRHTDAGPKDDCHAHKTGRERSYRFACADDFASCASDWDLCYEQLTSGRFEGHLSEIWIDSIQVLRERGNQAVLETGVNWDGGHSVGVIHSPVERGRHQGQEVDRHYVLSLQSNQELMFRTPREFDLLSATVDGTALARHFQSVENRAAGKLDLSGGARRDPEGAARLRQFLLAVISAVEAEPILLEVGQSRKSLAEAILDAVMEASLPVQDGDPGPVPSRIKRWMLREAREFMLAHVEEPITVLDLCRHLRVSRRTLQYCFQDLLGLNPVAYLRVLRLNGARRDLQRADPSQQQVAEIAARWGFWHLPRFAAYYRDLFGELPSDTLYRPDKSTAGAPR